MSTALLEKFAARIAEIEAAVYRRRQELPPLRLAPPGVVGPQAPQPDWPELPVGGWYGPEAKRIVLEGIQDEAAVHELAHAWADLAGFYRERAPDGPPWPIWHRPFRAAVKRAADDPDPRYATVQFLAHQYEYGDPALNFPGMFDNDPERFAGLASGTMGDTRKMPPYLAEYYRGLFRIEN